MLKTGTAAAVGLGAGIPVTRKAEAQSGVKTSPGKHPYNGLYSGDHINQVAFPIGGIGAGMICLEGTGGISHVSVRHAMQFFNEPCNFAAICVKGGEKNMAKVLEGPVPDRKVFGPPKTGNGAAGTDFGLPRYDQATFLARFPFATVKLTDDDMPLDVVITGWSPFVPGDEDSSSLPAGALEYTFKNTSRKTVEAVFSYNTKIFISVKNIPWHGNIEYGEERIESYNGGFILHEHGTAEKPSNEGAFAFFIEGDKATIDHSWFRGGWWDSLTMAWKNIEEGRIIDNPPVEGRPPGASLFVPFTLKPGQKKTVHLLMAWYVPESELRYGKEPEECSDVNKNKEGSCCAPGTYKPWYASKFKNINEVADFWRSNYGSLYLRSSKFRDTFYSMSLPDEVVEAAAANLTILKSPTVLRQYDGKLWCFEGCIDSAGCCHGSCTHVWNYAQAICHLFPKLERSLRDTEFNTSQNAEGHQTFRSNLPIRPVRHDFHAASDGQLGGIMKVYRDWRIHGETSWLKAIWPQVRKSLDYCIRTWDPKGKGVLEEPHHNTYDIEFWGPDGMCTSFYLGALAAAVEIGKKLDNDVSRYEELLEKGRRYLETELWNGEYFYQKVQWKGLEAKDPVAESNVGINMNYSPEAIELLQKEGPKYQYGTGCISDGVLGFWMARACGLGDIVDSGKVKSNLAAIYKHNLKRDLSDHVNPQRPTYAMGADGGLLLCTWPKGGMPSLPFVYSNEVWTGIEYQVASHLMMEGMADEGLDIVRVCRDRYDGTVRNPFNEYECGHWYARAMASYALIQGLTGVRYDAVDKTLHIDPVIGGDFTSFLSTATGYGNVGLKRGKPFLDIKEGAIEMKKAVVKGKEMRM
jgi:uncharacterized protein (DUF608 family)